MSCLIHASSSRKDSIYLFWDSDSFAFRRHNYTLQFKCFSVQCSLYSRGGSGGDENTISRCFIYASLPNNNDTEIELIYGIFYFTICRFHYIGVPKIN